MGGHAALRTFSELAGLDAPPASRLAMSLLPTSAGQPLVRVTACTDGSFDPATGEAAGAAALLGLME
eukprot:15201274-Alexandrium_andersonii.AAC.1